MKLNTIELANGKNRIDLNGRRVYENAHSQYEFFGSLAQTPSILGRNVARAWLVKIQADGVRPTFNGRYYVLCPGQAAELDFGQTDFGGHRDGISQTFEQQSSGTERLSRFPVVTTVNQLLKIIHRHDMADN